MKKLRKTKTSTNSTIHSSEKEVVNSVLRAIQEGKEGKNLEGDLDELAKMFSK